MSFCYASHPLVNLRRISHTIVALDSNTNATLPHRETPGTPHVGDGSIPVMVGSPSSAVAGSSLLPLKMLLPVSRPWLAIWYSHKGLFMVTSKVTLATPCLGIVPRDTL